MPNIQIKFSASTKHVYAKDISLTIALTFIILATTLAPGLAKTKDQSTNKATHSNQTPVGDFDKTKHPGTKPATAAKAHPKATEPVIENAISTTAEELVNKPQEFLNKNVKFTANFFAWSNLALDYKPAYRSSKTHMSFLVLKANTHIPLSELKLAMLVPKEKDPETALFASLKDGDQVELIGKVFSAALDDPWIEVYKLKRLKAAPDNKTASTVKEENKATESKDSKESKEKSKDETNKSDNKSSK